VSATAVNTSESQIGAAIKDFVRAEVKQMLVDWADGVGGRHCCGAQPTPQGADGADRCRSRFSADPAYPKQRPQAGELHLGAGQAAPEADAALRRGAGHPRLMGGAERRMTEVMSLMFGGDSS